MFSFHFAHFTDFIKCFLLLTTLFHAPLSLLTMYASLCAHCVHFSVFHQLHPSLCSSCIYTSMCSLYTLLCVVIIYTTLQYVLPCKSLSVFSMYPFLCARYVHPLLVHHCLCSLVHCHSGRTLALFSLLRNDLVA